MMHHFPRMRALCLSLPLALTLLIVIGLQFTGTVDAQQTTPPLVCPTGTTQIDLVTWDAVLTMDYNQSNTVTLTLSEDSSGGGLLVQSGVGHPEAGCPGSGDPICNDQDNESFNVLVDGVQTAFVPDHGNDQWQDFFFPLDLAAGQYEITFAHAMQPGNNPFGSVMFNAAFCAGVEDEGEPTPPPTDTPSPTPDPTVAQCSDANGQPLEIVRVDVPDGVTNLYCRAIISNGRIETPNAFAEIGNPAVIALGIQQAVDVFHLGDGDVSGTTLCLSGEGTFLFLGAASSPRFVEVLPAVSDDGFTCARLPGEGIAVLVQLPFDLPRTLDDGAAASAPLSDCRVTTQNMLNLRSEPSADGAVITVVPYDLTLTATEAVPGWYRVIFEDGQGWLSAAYLTTVGNCG